MRIPSGFRLILAVLTCCVKYKAARKGVRDGSANPDKLKWLAKEIFSAFPQDVTLKMGTFVQNVHNSPL